MDMLVDTCVQSDLTHACFVSQGPTTLPCVGQSRQILASMMNQDA